MVLGPVETVYLLALVPAVVWGFTPILDKRGMSLDGTAVQASLVVILVDLLLYGVALLVLRGPAAFAGIDPATAGVFLFAGIAGTALGRLAIFEGVHRVGASINSAVVSGRPLFATALAFGFLGEPVSPTTAVGIVVLVGGLVVLSLAKGGDLAGWRPRDLLYPLASAAALNEFGALLVFVGYAAVRGTRRFRSTEPRSYAYFAASGVLTATALLSVFAALSMPEGRVAVVDSLGSTAPLFTTVFAYFLLRDLERVTVGVVVGAVLVVVGAVLVTLGPGFAVG